MGWSSGTDLMEAIIRGVQPLVKDAKAREKLYTVIIDAMENADWDCQQECEGVDIAYDKALAALHPDWSADNNNGVSFCITGTLSRPRDEYIDQIVNAGFTYKRSVTEGLTYLVLADPLSVSTKACNARDLGVITISEDELMEILEDTR